MNKKRTETKESGLVKERTPNEVMLQLAINRLRQLAEDAEQSAFTGTILVQICYQGGRAVTVHRRYDGRDKL
jgi:hypothetical protein